MQLHRLLSRQLRKAGLDPEKLPFDLLPFIASVNSAYQEFDNERGLLERAMELSSDEMMGANRRMAHLVEQANAAAETKSNFMANMSHEIRTPLNGILGLVQMISDGNLSPSQRAHLELLGRSARGLLSILNDILDFSKLEAGKLAIQNMPMSPLQVLNDVMQTFESAFQGKNLETLIHTAPNLPHNILSDDLRLRQIMMNLISNAIKFTPPQGIILIYVTCERSSTDAITLEVSVADSGTGIPGDKLQDIFESFAQVDDTITRRFGGTGLGLSITRQLIGLMGGTISVNSILDVGSTFTVRIPCQIGTSQEPTVQTPATSPAPVASKARRVLVAEDNEINQRVILHLLKKMGWSATVAENGQKAVDLHRNEPFDLILMDCQMPIMSGFDATRTIRAEERGRSQHVPIIAMTALAMAGDNDRCKESGMDDYVMKPFEANKVRALLHQWSERIDGGPASVDEPPSQR